MIAQPDRSAVTRYETVRFSTALPGTFEAAVSAFETAVPALSVAALAGALAEHRDWSHVEEWTAAEAPHGFLIYWKNDVRPLFAIAGDTDPCVAYLMGNHVFAERMFRHDPRVMNYAPLRVEISRHGSGPVQFTAEIPSLQFASFGIDAVTEVGRELDAELRGLLHLLGGELPEAARP